MTITIEKDLLNDLRALHVSLRNVGLSYARLHMHLDELEVEKQHTEKKIAGLKQELQAHQVVEEKLIEKVTKEYGIGSVDLETGVFTPDVEKVNP